MRLSRYARLAVLALALGAAACGDDDDPGPMGPQPVDPDTAPRASVDRFSDDFATLFRRSANPALPAAGAPIDMDQEPFKSMGLGPQGQPVRYYNFDVMSTQPAPIYLLFREGESAPVDGQLNIVDVIPGDAGYSDFWRPVRVTVPADYVANTATSLSDLQAAGYAMQTLDAVVNCPIVPEGSTADEGGGAEGLHHGWYKDQVVAYFNFGEADLSVTGSGMVPTSPIFVSFNVDPDQDGGGPASGFRTQGSSAQTHNVLATIPGDPGYSPLWEVMPYTNEAFDDVHDLPSAQEAMSFGTAALVNCPVVFVGDIPGDADTVERVVTDRFSDDFGTLFRRSANPDLPAPGEAIDMDQAPFITQGLGPDGRVVRYYNFDVLPTEPAPIYVLFRESGEPVAGQHNIVDVMPGDDGYSDFWRVVRVTVPDAYIANSATSFADLQREGFAMAETDVLVNCPIVPEGSTAEEGGGADGLTLGWYQGLVVHYFNFGAPITATASGRVPTSPIFVSFNVNPDQPDGGPASGFRTEADGVQTHNVVATVPGQDGYSPFWEVMPYDNAAFDDVHDLPSALEAMSFGTAALVNCPIVFVEP